MEIKIAAEKMLLVLTNNGIDETDAKAIVCDLLLAANDPSFGKEKGPPRKALERTVETRRARRAREVHEVHGEEVSEEEPEPEAEPEPPRKQTKKLSRKRVSFSAFGGTADPLR